MLNCYHPIDGEPCGECQSCKTTLKGQNWDVREVDVARFRGIDEVKELAYNTWFAPFGKKKVYLLDEAHMFSEQAWNALLKLIEEPPPHLVIIICTTQRDKIPITIQSRTLIFPFLPIKSDNIKAGVIEICNREGYSAAFNSHWSDRVFGRQKPLLM